MSQWKDTGLDLWDIFLWMLSFTVRIYWRYARIKRYMQCKVPYVLHTCILLSWVVSWLLTATRPSAVHLIKHLPLKSILIVSTVTLLSTSTLNNWLWFNALQQRLDQSVLHAIPLLLCRYPYHGKGKIGSLNSTRHYPPACLDRPPRALLHVSSIANLPYGSLLRH